jgi:hypothetical protein
MLHCGIYLWGGSIERSGVVDCRYLTILTGSSTSIIITYIVFVTKMQKGKPFEMDLPLLENDITSSEPAFGIADI